ncbi:MAG: hypothetical protein ABI346_06675 [Candidatus Baltobacteraceae bacterium]
MGRRKLPGITILYHPATLEELRSSLAPSVQADVIAKVDRLNGRPQPEIVSMLDRRTEPKVFQWEGSAEAGTLRIVFAWGKGCLWMIGAFVKVNDKEGERYMRRILRRAVEVRNWDEKR